MWTLKFIVEGFTEEEGSLLFPLVSGILGSFFATRNFFGVTG